MPYLDATLEQIQQHSTRYTFQMLSLDHAFMTEVENRQDAERNGKSFAPIVPKQVPVIKPTHPKTSARAITKQEDTQSALPSSSQNPGQTSREQPAAEGISSTAKISRKSPNTRRKTVVSDVVTLVSHRQNFPPVPKSDDTTSHPNPTPRRRQTTALQSGPIPARPPAENTKPSRNLETSTPSGVIHISAIDDPDPRSPGSTIQDLPKSSVCVSAQSMKSKPIDEVSSLSTPDIPSAAHPVRYRVVLPASPTVDKGESKVAGGDLK